jgi:hypothetical protein
MKRGLTTKDTNRAKEKNAKDTTEPRMKHRWNAENGKRQCSDQSVFDPWLVMLTSNFGRRDHRRHPQSRTGIFLS